MARKRVITLLMAAFLIAGAGVAVAQASTHGRSQRHDGDQGAVPDGQITIDRFVRAPGQEHRWPDSPALELALVPEGGGQRQRLPSPAVEGREGLFV